MVKRDGNLKTPKNQKIPRTIISVFVDRFY